MSQGTSNLCLDAFRTSLSHSIFLSFLLFAISALTEWLQLDKWSSSSSSGTDVLEKHHKKCEFYMFDSYVIKYMNHVQLMELHMIDGWNGILHGSLEIKCIL
jgi:hypothetical protein